MKFNGVELTREQAERFAKLYRDPQYKAPHYDEIIIDGMTARDIAVSQRWEFEELQYVEIPAEYYVKYIALWRRWGQKRFKRWAAVRVWKDKFYTETTEQYCPLLPARG